MNCPGWTLSTDRELVVARHLRVGIHRHLR
jgi:hypothetical protein